MTNGYLDIQGSYVPARNFTPGWLCVAALLVYLSVLPLQWYGYRTPLGLTVRPVHLSFILLLLAFPWGRGVVGTCLRPWQQFRLFVFFYMAYLCVYTTGLLWTPHTLEGVAVVLKMAIYFFWFLVLTVFVTSVQESRIEKGIRLAVPLGVLMFLAIAVTIFSVLGKDIVGDFFQSLLQRDVNTFMHGFYPVLFNYVAGDVVTKENAEFVGTALRNTLVGSFILFFILNQSYLAVQGKAQLRRRYFYGLMSLLTFCFVLLSVSRSNIIALFVAVVFAQCLGWFGATRHHAYGYYGKRILVLLALFLVMAMNVELVSGAFNILSDRLGSIASDPRLSMFQEAAGLIDRAPIAGHGIGVEVKALAGKQHRIHNLFLATWAEVGLLGFLCALGFYASLVMAWLGYVWQVVRRPRRWVLKASFQWIMALPVLPLFRSLVSGGGGSFTLIEWTCLALFVGFVSQNEICRAALARKHPDGVGVSTQ